MYMYKYSSKKLPILLDVTHSITISGRKIVNFHFAFVSFLVQYPVYVSYKQE